MAPSTTPVAGSRARAAGMILAFATALSLAACTPPEQARSLPTGDTAALHVDGTPVSLDEYTSCLREELAGVLLDAEDVGQGNDLDAATVEGRPALDVLRERGAVACADEIVRRTLGVRLGAIPDATLESSLTRWDLHNEQRRGRADAGEVVYGPLELSYEDFDAIEQAEFATAAELPLIDALLADPLALDAAAVELTGEPAPVDEAERRIAAQAVARERIETQLKEASAAASIDYADWLDELAVGSIIER
ncbi:hypothetical protein [Microbacterium sp. MYb62]|uniref:hypothetical protein n=1 Tax=Microbacterium sp. MYb62 TaxID=1848690 RepID=UPI000CFCBBBF|nr:hypothetical protein [Microbacterium sp. MYb62]PRB15986.1 hypothetical protein CQ042_07660 [Microbacterium sp. MYb62]